MKQEMMTIVEQKQLAPRIFQMTLSGELVNEMGIPGQFLHIKVPREDFLLRRPISINQIDKEEKTCTIIYRTEGDGTLYFSNMSVGEKLDVMGPLGNGFDVSFLEAGQKVYIVGGGIGIPPLYELSRQLKEKGVEVVHFLGYASKAVSYFQNEFIALGDTRFATDDGTFGINGNVGNLLLDALKDEEPAAVFACGANGMLKAVAQLFPDNPNVFLSMEQRMACGMGACYACVCHVPDDATGVKSVKVCDEGPIFRATEVVL
ncbi:dihydroorotate dehydrogenase electron transfer subunit [Enterococcus sp. BWB1-3]|uniref:dihydroorotate dehydrogenase electron transfer subunit n=1 Tax=unclassified Enterococcus TaxID=2608891 RepID=UPI0019224BF0|nr:MULTISPECIES: dihydroorotate dehydrogenase electron transfer subunit [unclassified Enterococcus]MBL1228557.1 dihydroorotate dehydrogenase electron transfer subunit [Enterococcus sp. BWB1-3]MCB5950562.1 dihydroorotate dehydrogenase electron transfer subunit [Enterococcus sp. BWT-B8]MCB5955887.1 dihydroorotate dehydrogenase electron transfer subunit [Enterococcus sp. CWB-B31]